jgi:hypothetical protein
MLRLGGVTVFVASRLVVLLTSAPAAGDNLAGAFHCETNILRARIFYVSVCFHPPVAFRRIGPGVSSVPTPRHQGLHNL